MASMLRILLILAFVAIAAPADAAPKCYGRAEAEAESAIRIHSELMVTALTCQYSSTGQSLVDMYVAFGKRNGARLREAEQTLISFHKINGGAGVAALDRMRTVLGNEYAERIAINDPGLYCPKVSETVVAAAQWNPAQFETAIQRAASASPGMVPACVIQAKQ